MRANRYISMPSAAKAMPNPVRRKRQQYFEKPRSDAIVPTRFDARTVLGCALPYLLKSQPAVTAAFFVLVQGKFQFQTETDRI